MRRLWIVTELFYPEETSTAFILTKIANRLSKNLDVHVICAPSPSLKNHVMSVDESDKINPLIKIHRVSATKLNKNKLCTRILRFLLLSWKLSWMLWKNLRSDDKIFIVTNPAPLMLLVALIKKIKGNYLYILVHDVFPENTIPAKILSSNKSLFYKSLCFLFNQAYRLSDTLIVLGRDMKEVMQKKLGNNSRNTQISIIENWAEIDKVDAYFGKKESEISQYKVEIQYAGNLGRVQGLLPLLELIKEACNKDLHFSFWGDGAIKEEMEQYVQTHNLLNVNFCGSYKRNEQNRILNECDLAIITLAEGMRGLGVPSKTYNILAAGKPILFIGDLTSEVALLIKEHQIGYCFAPTDKDNLLNFFRTINSKKLDEFIRKGRKARSLAETQYTESLILDKYCALIQSL